MNRVGAGSAAARRGSAAGSIAHKLHQWYAAGHRDLPWRRTTDPYRIWISEIMLQQTRAQAVIPYYERFLSRFPDVESLAAAQQSEVLALWSGLGYYSRARNIHASAKRVAGGAMPQDYAGWRALPGVGDYTAAAIASIAYSQPHAAVDGNVLRVVARVENDAADIGSARTRERFRIVAQSWLGSADPAGFNQAMMELGATVCLPKNPLCLLCPIADVCQARQAGTASQLPVKLRRTKPVKLEGVLLVVRRGELVLLRQRDSALSRMAGFWDLPDPENLKGARGRTRLGQIRHTITHHHYTLSVESAELTKVSVTAPFQWFGPADLNSIPLSTTARKALKLAGIV